MAKPFKLLADKMYARNRNEGQSGDAMKVKRIKVGMKDAKGALNDFVRIGEAVMRGDRPKKTSGIYFESYESLRRALTPQRLELLHLIKEKRPDSVSALARMCKRDVKNVNDDLRYLERIGLIELQEDKNCSAPAVSYDRIAVEIAI